MNSPVRLRKAKLALLAPLLSSLVGCPPQDEPKGPDDKKDDSPLTLPTTDYDAALALAARGRECGVISEGYWSWEFYPGQFCETRCMLRASCADFERYACDQRPVAKLEDCFDECDDDDVAQCGDGTTIPADKLCDLSPDCSTGEDEKHCERFRCGDGRGISSWRRCDGEPDCEDESDEDGCALVCGEPRVKVEQ